MGLHYLPYRETGMSGASHYPWWAFCMENLKNYLKYYSLEDYLFNEVSANFRKKGFLTTKEFFAIVIWKSNRAKTRVLKGIKKNGKTIRQLTSEVNKENDDKKKVGILEAIQGIGIPIASAILAVCYPKIFTIADYRTKESLTKKNKDFKGKPTTSILSYLKYSKACHKIAEEEGLSLRDTDRALWGVDFYEGKNGLKELVKNLA